MTIDIDYIKQLTNIITTNGLTEISLEDGEQAITIRKEVIVCPPEVNVTEKTEQKPKEEAKVVSQKGHAIVSPMVGTFYISSSPDNPPFVEVGSDIKEGDIVCVIEAMKLMNEIKSDYTGKITQICVQNGDPIEYGQVLMYVE